ncbi:MAG: hypothetical protein KAJ36_09800 [Candidatus Thorarchaeota archaeon]|nr:hypothetical protein [Candidatus Thorarchaeota archaeon]
MQITTDIPPSTPIIDPLVMDVFLFIVLIGLFTYILQRQSRSQKNLNTSSMKPSLTVLIVSLLLITLFGPSNLNIYLELGRIYLIGMSWELGSFMLSFTFFLVGLPFMFFRLVFVYQVYKYYLGTTSRKRVVITGILGELQFPIISLLMIPICLSNPNLAVIISIPIPILLIAGLLMLRYIPKLKGISEWTELDEDKDWWDKEKEDVVQ